MLKKSVAILSLAIILCMTGCSNSSHFKIQPAEPDGTYATATRLTALEYSLYMNKQLTVFATQINTRMLAVQNAKDTDYVDEAKLAEESKDIMHDARAEVEVTYPSEGRDDDRETTLEAMDVAIADMEKYIEALKSGQDVSDFADIFENDFNALTGLANLYYE